MKSSRNLRYTPLRKRPGGESVKLHAPINTSYTESSHTIIIPAPYASNLTPIPSELRPHILAKERLEKWIPISHFRENGSPLTADEERLTTLLAQGWDESTLATYGSGLLVYHVFCDSRHIKEEEHAPIAHNLLSIFISELAGSYSKTTIVNYISGVRAWHLLHRLRWETDEKELEVLLCACIKAAPASSKKPKCTPWTPEFIARIHAELNPSECSHVATYACLTSTFYAAARLGELTVTAIKKFDPSAHPTPADVRTEMDRQGLTTTIIHVPSTKASKHKGEDVYWTEQPGITDPKAALDRHLSFNKPPRDGHLFAYKAHDGKYRPLTRKKFITIITAAATKAGIGHLQGHSIRIGATLEYLLRGVSFKAMKAKGRWASDAFARYLTNHAQILAQHTQGSFELHDSITRITIPRLRR